MCADALHGDPSETTPEDLFDRLGE